MPRDLPLVVVVLAATTNIPSGIKHTAATPLIAY